MATTKKPTGRPSKYSDTVQKKADKFIDEFDGPIISAAAMALHLKVNKDTLYEWAHVHPIFSDTLKRMNAVQEAKALADGYSNNANATIVKLLLANHGYSEKQQVDNVSSDGSMTPKDSMQAVLDALERKHESL